MERRHLAPLPETEELLRDASYDHAGIAEALEEVRATHEVPPSPSIAAEHLSAIMGAVRGEQPEVIILKTARPRRRRRIYAVLVPAAALTMMVAFASLSYANVITLPKSIRSMYATLGFNLPEPTTPANVQNGDSPAIEDGKTSPNPSDPQTGEVARRSTNKNTTVDRDLPVGPPANSGDSSTGTLSGDSPENPGGKCDLPKALCGL